MKKQFINIASIMIFLFILIGGLFYLNYKNQDNIVNSVSKNSSGSINNSSGSVNKKSLDNKNYTEGIDLFISKNYTGAIDYYEKKVKEKNTYEDKIFLTSMYLEYGKISHKELEYSKMTMDILNTMDEKFEVLYNKGHAFEIIENYNLALNYYNKGLKIKDLDNQKRTLLLKQIGNLKSKTK